MANFNMNKVILGGRLTANPELKQTQSGVMVTSFTIGASRRFVAKAEGAQSSQPQADFISCVAWRERAEHISKYFRKGSSICIVGQIQTRSWTDQDGSKRYATEVVVDEVYFVDSKGDGTAPSVAAGSAQSVTPACSSGYIPQTAVKPAGQAAEQMSFPVPQFEVLEGDDDLPF